MNLFGIGNLLDAATGAINRVTPPPPPALPPIPRPVSLAPPQVPDFLHGVGAPSPPQPLTLPDTSSGPPSSPPTSGSDVVANLYSQATSQPGQGQMSPLGVLGMLAQVAALRSAGTSTLPGGGGGGGPIPMAGSASDQKFLNILHNQLGDPYVFGAAGPNQFDCSGLVDFALNQAGIKVPRLSAAGYQQLFGAHLSANQLRPGDPVFFWYPNDRGIAQGQASHIGIYWGNGKFIEAPHTGDVVKIAPMDWSAFIGGARIPGLWGG